LGNLVFRKRRRIWLRFNVKRDFPKLKKENNKRGREESHITEEVEEAEKKKSKKEEARSMIGCIMES